MTIPNSYRTETNEPDKVYVTNRDIYQMITEMSKEISALKSRVAVLYITHGIIVAGVTAMFLERMKG